MTAPRALTWREQVVRVVLHRIGLVVHGGKERAVETATDIETWTRRHNVETRQLDVWSPDTQRQNARDEVAAAGPLDLIVTVGGDGTFLRGMRIAMAADVPVLGVDVGRVGFLTEVEARQAISALEAFAAGNAVIEQRMTLTVRANRPLSIPDGLESFLRYGRGPTLPPPHVHAGLPEDVGWGVGLDIAALNDVTFEKLSRDRQVSLAVYIDGRRFVSYSADALVVATPTGSTAYSISAGGPVVSPRAEVLIITPVAAHMMFDRSLLLGSDESIAVIILERSGQVVATVDGQIRGVLDPGDWCAVYARPNRAQLVRLTEPDFFGRVRDRFRVADAAAAEADGTPPPFYRPNLPVPPDLRELYLPQVPGDQHDHQAPPGRQEEASPRARTVPPRRQ
jgi:NAD+ kinase